jgi:hypothetical protein
MDQSPSRSRPIMKRASITPGGPVRLSLNLAILGKTNSLWVGQALMLTEPYHLDCSGTKWLYIAFIGRGDTLIGGPGGWANRRRWGDNGRKEFRFLAGLTKTPVMQER